MFVIAARYMLRDMAGLDSNSDTYFIAAAVHMLDNLARLGIKVGGHFFTEVGHLLGTGGDWSC